MLIKINPNLLNNYNIAVFNSKVATIIPTQNIFENTVILEQNLIEHTINRL